MIVVVDKGGGGMEPTAPIIVVDSSGKDAKENIESIQSVLAA